MIFSATYACAACRLRFSRRLHCPSCGSADIFALATREGRARYRAAARRTVGARAGILLRLASWAPQRLLLPIGLAILAMAPAGVGLMMGPHSFEERWLMDDLTTRWEGLSYGGITMIALAAVGAALLVFIFLAMLGRASAEPRPTHAPRTRVHAPGEEARGETTLTGIARRASVEIASVVAGAPCLLFGLTGEVGNADIADADGGDFDLELPSGERVMISLEHAILIADARPAGGEPLGEIGSALAVLLESRGVVDAEGRAFLREHLVRDGDEVTVFGDVLGGKVTSVAYRGASGARVLAGSEERPLIVHPAQ